MKGSDSQESGETFDAFAKDYDAALEKGISISGEDKNYFAKVRVNYLARRLQKYGVSTQKILDFGCGTGSAIPYLLQTFPKAFIVGVEVSSKSIEIAQGLHKSDRVKFALIDEHWADGSFDLVFCNGVFHHIPSHLRQESLQNILAALKPGGFFSFWENNPWNLGTRIVMSRIPFDRDADTISPFAARNLLKKYGFNILESASTFYFPRILSILRPLEVFLAQLPLGAQYMILAQKS
jgi:SAM-dependent methyltransferase